MIRLILTVPILGALAACAPGNDASVPTIGNAMRDRSLHMRCFDPGRGIVYAHDPYTLSCLAPDYRISKSDFVAWSDGARFQPTPLSQNQNDTSVTDRCYGAQNRFRPDLARADGPGCDAPAYRVSEAEHQKRVR